MTACSHSCMNPSAVDLIASFVALHFAQSTRWTVVCLVVHNLSWSCILCLPCHTFLVLICTRPQLAPCTALELHHKVAVAVCYLPLSTAFSVLDVACMQAEADFWRKSEGYRVGWSDELLGFDCGGQQWVLETCFPTGSLR